MASLKGSHTSWRAAQSLANVVQVDNNGLDPVAFAFDLGLQAFHFVTVEGVGNILQHEVSKEKV